MKLVCYKGKLGPGQETYVGDFGRDAIGALDLAELGVEIANYLTKKPGSSALTLTGDMAKRGTSRQLAMTEPQGLSSGVLKELAIIINNRICPKRNIGVAA